MKLHRLELRGIRPHYAEAVTLDVDALPGPIVAVCGVNGSGKSVLLGSIMGSLYREWPTSAGMVDMALRRDGMVRIDATLPGGRTVIAQHGDAVARTGESYITRDGVALLKTGKVTEYDAWAATNLPPSSIIYASSFGAQGSAGLLDPGLTPQERRNILFRALRLDEIEPLPSRCRERAAEARLKLGQVEARIVAETPFADVAQAEANLTGWQAVRAAAEMTLGHAREDLDAARARHAALVAAWNDAEAAKKARAQAIARMNAEKTKRITLVSRLETARRDAAGAPEVEAAAAKLDEVQREVAQLETSLATTAQAIATARREAQAAEDAVLRAAVRIEAASKRVQAADAARKRLVFAEDAAAKIVAAEAAEQAADAALREAWDAVESLRGATLDVAGQRISVLRAGLSTLADGEYPRGDAPTIAESALDEDNAIARAAQEAPAKLAAAQEAHRKAQAASVEASRVANTLRVTAATVGDLREAARAGEAAEAEVRSLVSGKLDVERVASETRARIAALQSNEDADKQILADAKRRREVVKATAARGPAIAAAQATVAEISPQLAAADDAVRAAEADLALAPEPPAAEPVPDVAAQERAAQEAEKALRAAEGAVAVGEDGVRKATEAAGRVALLQAERAATLEEIADWERLEADIRSVLQLSIDAAAPEIAAMTNQLLREAYGPRYTVTIETTRPSADGKKQIEDCYPHVIDAANGVDGSADCLSPGQRAIVGEAVRFAITHIVCRSAGITGPTIVRDESAGAVAEATLPEWVTMLRIGARLLGSSHVFVVCHNSIAETLADARVRVSDGRLTID